MRARPEWRKVPPEQYPFIFSGKRYLLARFIAQIVLVIAFVVRVSRGGSVLTPIAAAGAAMMIAGFAVRWWARAVMGERFRGFEVRREDRGLETRGPYARLRHPGYLGLVLMDIGLPLLLGIPWGLTLSAVLVGLVLDRISLEERLLATMYPDYATYAATRKRLLPGVW